MYEIRHCYMKLNSFAGCYKGQETISRLVTYDGIKQRFWGIRLSSQVAPGSIITVDGKKVMHNIHSISPMSF